jgi:hypothetical protein
MLLDESAVAVTPVGALGTVAPPPDTGPTDTHEDREPSPALFTADTLKYHVESVLLLVLSNDVVYDVPSSEPEPLPILE